jgi:serine/threonine protein phosphatase PrpC
MNIKMQVGDSFSTFHYRKSFKELSLAKKDFQEFLLTQTVALKGKTRSEGNFKAFNKAIRLPPIQKSLDEREKKACLTGKSVKVEKKSQIFKKITDSVTRCLFKTVKGTVNGRSKSENQDSFIAKSSVLGQTGIYLFAVCDGHGEQGQTVAFHIKKNFILILESLLIRSDPEKALCRTFKKLDEEIKLLSVSEFSGSTCVSVLVIGNQLYCCNVGDSRAIIVRFDQKTKHLNCIALSNDHKPENFEEAERIKRMGGRIKPANSSTSESNLRVWLEDEEVPGLCMTRSLGDSGCKSIGVTSEAELLTYTLEGSEYFLILASDGIWQFLSNEEAAGLVLSSISSNPCSVLCEEARRRWSLNCTSTDDITVLVVFFKDFP